MPGDQIRLLALDGGGVRGLSSLMILQQLMATVDPESPPKPCDYFDMIGGTSTGGLIAIMLGRLQMTVGECIDKYTSLSDKVFEKRSHRVTIRGKIQGRFDTAELERAVKQILSDRGFDQDTLLKDTPDAPCKIFVCATSKQTSDTVCLTSYQSRRGGSDLLDSTKIWQACRATSAATSFFDPISIGPFDEEFVDGALGPGVNNPVYALWNQAQDVWGNQLWGGLKCLVSVGTGVPTLQPVRDDVLGIWSTLQELATETETTAERFRRDKSSLDEEGRYYRFNVDRGLEDINLEESKKKREIAAATRRYIALEAVFKQMKACANSLVGREYHGPYRTVFTLQSVPVSDKFVDRPSDMAEIKQCLLPRPRPGQRRRRIFVLYGLGGIGKTQLAVDFARRYQAMFSSIFWLDGRSEDRLRQSLASCAARIPKGQIPDRNRGLFADDGSGLNLVVTDVLAWLARPDNINWLLIFDNVGQDYEQDSATGAYDVRKYLPGDHGSILITTRLSQLAQLGSSKRLRKVDEELSKSIFQQWYGRELVMDETGRELLGLLDGLPLALAQAASYLNEIPDIVSYIRMYKQQWDDLMRADGEANMLLVDYERSIGTTWTISFKMIEGRSKNAANLLRLWAFLDNKELWRGLLQAVTDDRNQWPGWLGDIASNEVSFLNAVRLLLRYSMIEAQESVQGSYVLHPVVHRWASHIQTALEKKDFLRLAVMVVGSAVPSKMDKGYWMLQNRLLPHAERCSWWIENICKAGWIFDDIMTIASMHMLGVLYADQGKFNEAEEMYQRTLAGSGKALGLSHTITLRTVNSLAILYLDRGRVEDAEMMFQRALAGYEKSLGPDHPSTLDTVNNLAIIYLDQGRLEEGEKMFQRALAGYEKHIGPDHKSSLLTVNNLGILYHHQGELEKAEKMIQRTLAGYEKDLGPDHTSTLRTVNSLAIIYSDQGKLEEAEMMFQRALAGYEKSLGADHTYTLDTVSNLAVIFENQGELDKAEKMFQRALAGYEKSLGADHTYTLDTVNNLAVIFKNHGELDKAEKMFQQALAGYEKALGPGHPSTLDTLNNLAIIYLDQGNLEEAEKIFQRELTRCETAIGSDHISTLRTVNDLGKLYRVQGKLEEAEKMIQRALTGYETALGPDHTSTLGTVNDLGKLYRDQGKLDEAEKMYKRLLAGREAMGPDHIPTLDTVSRVDTVSNIGNIYYVQG